MRTMGDVVKRRKTREKVGMGSSLRDYYLFAGGSVTIDSFQGICVDERHLIMCYSDDWSVFLMENTDIIMPSSAKIMVIQP